MTPQRLTWLDLVRGVCVLGMIETHVLNTFLVPAAREQSWFLWLNYLNGLIAPAFLFVAGYTQGLSMRQSGAKPRVWGRRVRRLVAVGLLGYALHFPAPQLFAGQWMEAHRLGTQVDVLQCLCVSLLLLLAIERYARAWADALAALGIAVFVFGLREEIAASWSFAPMWLLAFFNKSTGSLFPLIPWLGFVFGGFLTSAPLARGSRLAAWAAIVAVAFVAGGSISFYCERLGTLLALVPVAQWISARWEPRWLLWCGRESLVIYASHLVLIELLATTVLPRKALAPAPCAAAAVVVLAATLAFTLGWTRFRTQRAA